LKKYRLLKKIKVQDLDSIKLVRVSETNIDQVFQVYKECEDFLSLGPEPKASLDMVYKDLEYSRESSGIYNLIMDENGCIIGIIDYIPYKYGKNGDYCYISLIMIKSQYRSQGYGKRVLREIEESVHRAYGISQFRASVQINNEKVWLPLLLYMFF
jgi:RimJ/RimL family protein N-acetyltransferase